MKINDNYYSNNYENSTNVETKKTVKNKKITCRNKILKTCDFFKILEVNFSYSKKTKLKRIEKKIET